MAERIPTAIQNAMVSVISTATDAGAGPGTIKVYSGTQPATANAAPTGTLLASFTLNDPAWSAPAAGVITLDVDPAITTTGAATGAPGWARIADSAGVVVIDCSVGTSGTDLILNTATVTAGAQVSITSLTVTQPAQ